MTLPTATINYTAELADVFAEAEQRMTWCTGTLAELLAMLPALRSAMAEIDHLHRHHTGPARVILNQVEALEDAVHAGVINRYGVHLRQLRRIGVFGEDFRGDLRVHAGRQQHHLTTA